ncbi:MAG: hypothetical protein EOL97_13445 [Spirochaetia bacterium]|nr:hypothetical protein [Spirochaetia bacterium]
MSKEVTDKLINRLPNHYLKRNSSNNYKILYSIAQELASFKLQSNNLQDELHIDTASGTNLDRLGLLFKLLRNIGETDASYRNRIKAFWQGIISCGVESSILKSLSSLLNISLDKLSIKQEDTAIFSINIEIDENTNFLLFELIENDVNKTKALGTYYKKNNYSSANNLFLVNFSTVNGENEIL